MRDPVDRAIRAIARRNSFALVWAQFGVAHLVILAGLALLLLYQPMSAARFGILVGVSQLLDGIDTPPRPERRREPPRPTGSPREPVAD